MSEGGRKKQMQPKQALWYTIVPIIVLFVCAVVFGYICMIPAIVLSVEYANAKYDTDHYTATGYCVVR